MGISFLEEVATFQRGQLGAGPHRYSGSRRVTVAAPAGVFVVPTDDGTCALPTSAAQVEAGRGGVLEYLVDRMPNANGLEYAANDYCRYITWGNIVVVTEEAVSDEDDVYVRFATKLTNTQLGACRTDSDGDGAESLVLTNAITANTNINIVIDDESFVIATGASGNASTIAGLIATAIDGSAAFAAAAVGADVTVTRVDGGSPGDVSLELPNGITSAYGTDSDPETAALWPRAKFLGDAASGLAMVQLF